MTMDSSKCCLLLDVLQSILKSNLLQTIRPAKNPCYNICDITGVKSLTRPIANFSSLNEHRFRHNFDGFRAMCGCGAAREDTEHYLLHCLQFSVLRQHLLGEVSDVGYDVARMSSKYLCHLLLYGKPIGGIFVNRISLEATISSIKYKSPLYPIVGFK